VGALGVQAEASVEDSSAANIVAAPHFASIAAKRFGAAGDHTFAPNTFSNTGGSIKIADGGPGGTGKTVTLNATEAVDPLETVATSKSNPFAGRFVVSGAASGAGSPAQAGHAARNSVMVGANGLPALLSGASASATTSSASFGYTFSPSTAGVGSRAEGGRVVAQTAARTANATPAHSATGNFAADGVTFNPHASADHRPLGTSSPEPHTLPRGADSTLGYHYTPISQATAAAAPLLPSASAKDNPGSHAAKPSPTVATVASVPTANGSVFASSIVGSGVSNTPVAAPNGTVKVASSMIDFGTMTYGADNTLYLALQNVGAEGSSLTIEGYTIAGGEASAFGASITPGTVIAAGGTLVVPLIAYGSELGELTSNLTIFTDQGAALGGIGATFTYLLDPLVVGLSVPAPEPASIAIIGMGLAGLSALRRRRKAVATSRTPAL
jgi:hypothetical protein